MQSTAADDPPMTRFFHDFERYSTQGEFAPLLLQFADIFMAASPQGTHCVRVSDFALALPKRKALFDGFGCRSTQLARIEEIPFNSSFTLVHTQWRMMFLQAGVEKEALADSTFIVDTTSENFKIVFYLAHQDHMTMLQRQGIIGA